MLIVDKRAKNQWQKSCYSYNNYLEYIRNKSDNSLSLIDILHVSNFKGGNATVNESEVEINDKLTAYREHLDKIAFFFDKKSLAHLTSDEVELLTDLILRTCDLAKKGAKTKIDGFGISYLSALMHLHFPQLIPILDRRVLISAELVSWDDRDSQDQIKNIVNFYKPLVLFFSNNCKSRNLTIREFDKELFTRKISQVSSTKIK